MTANNPPDPTRQLVAVWVSPPPELVAYAALEDELDIIAAGEPASLAFKFAVALISAGVSFVLTLTTTTITSDLLFIIYLNVCVICLLAGAITFAFWLKTRTSVNTTVTKIKSRLIVLTPVQEPLPGDPTTGP